jgi:hypothetical protein
VILIVALLAAGCAGTADAPWSEPAVARLAEPDPPPPAPLPEPPPAASAVVLEGLDPERRFAIRLDGGPVQDDGRRPLELSVPPGTHRIEVMAAGYETFMSEVEIAAGEREPVAVRMATRARPPPPDPTEGIDDAGGGAIDMED